MPPKVSRDVKHKALNMMAQGQTEVNVAEYLDISDRTIHRARSKLRDHGDIEGGARQKGRKPKLTPQMEDVY